MVVAGPAMATKTAVCWPGACRSPEVVIAWQQQGRKGGGGDDKSSEELVYHERPSSEAEERWHAGIGEYLVNIVLRSEDRSEAGDRRAMAQDCARSCSGRTRTRTKR